jgi:hypothetical protein
MTGQQLIDKFEFLVDDTTTDSTRVLELINAGYKAICSRRVWNFLLSTDTSNTIASGTTSYSLPSDFLLPVALRVYDSTNDIYDDWAVVPFRNRRDHYNSTGYAVIDKKNSNVLLTADPADSLFGDTIELDYTYLPADLATGTEPVLPDAFHSILAYEAAKNFFYAEQSDRVSEGGFDAKMAAEYNRLYSAMIDYDMLYDDGVDDNYVPEKDWSGLN